MKNKLHCLFACQILSLFLSLLLSLLSSLSLNLLCHQILFAQTTPPPEPRHVYLVGTVQNVLQNALQNTLISNAPSNTPNWTPLSPATEMKLQSHNTYFFKGVLPAGEYLYKIAINGNWLENYGQSGIRGGRNIEFAINETQEVSFIYNDDTHAISDSTHYEIQEEKDWPYLVELQSSMKDFDFDNIFEISKEMEPGDYHFHVRYMGASFALDPIHLEKKQNLLLIFDRSLMKGKVILQPIPQDAVLHDTFSSELRKPFLPIRPRQPIYLAVQIKKGFAQNVELILNNKAAKSLTRKSTGESLMPASDSSQIWDTWFTTIEFTKPGFYKYRFRINKDYEYGAGTLQGGSGLLRMGGEVPSFEIAVYDPGFKTPKWLKNGIIYQIFPDRFFNGDPSTDTARLHTRGPQKVTLKPWEALPPLKWSKDVGENPSCDAFYGGDLKGIEKKLDYLENLGINILYLNPIFSSGCNDGYDIFDFFKINPLFGSMADFESLVREIKKRNMHIILDIVLNHVGDDSIYFNRFKRHTTLGAYEWAEILLHVKHQHPELDTATLQVKALEQAKNQGKVIPKIPWYKWFEISPPQNQNPSTPLIYTGWAGESRQPVFSKARSLAGPKQQMPWPSVLHNEGFDSYFFKGPQSVLRWWMQKGVEGWRFDVVTEMDPHIWPLIRQSVKKQNPNSALVGEVIENATNYLQGDKFDSVTNYRFRSAVLKSFLIRGDAEDAEHILKNILQSYPQESIGAAMNLLSSHDTSRALFYLDSGGNESQGVTAKNKENFDYERGKKLLKLALVFQMGFVGVPTIYYGDEVGLFGANTPDNRRTFPWGHEDQDLLTFYKDMIQWRKANQKILTQGEVEFLYAKKNVFVFKRSLNRSLILAFNRGSRVEKLQLPDGTSLELAPMSYQIR